MSAQDRMPRLREIFAQESDRRLTRMAATALRMENDADSELVAELFRDAHTVKGSASMMGFADITELAHAVEDLLDDLQHGRRGVDPRLIDTLLAAVDDLRGVTAATLAGQPSAELSAGARDRLRTALISQGLEAAADTAPHPALPDPAPALAASPDTPPAWRPAGPAGTGATTAGSAPLSEGLVVQVDRLDEMVRLVGECATTQLQLARVLTGQGIDVSMLTEFRELSRWLGQLQQQTMRARTVPVTRIVGMLHRAVREAARSQGKEVRWEVRGEDIELDRDLLERLSAALLHVVRNAVDHGIEPPTERRAAGKQREGVVRLHAMQLGSEVVLTVTDDGRGLDLAALRAQAAASDEAATAMSDEQSAYLVFRKGLSTAGEVTTLSGRGVGMDAVRRSLEEVRGRAEVHTTAGTGSEFRLAVPITLAVLPSLIVTAGGQRFALPMHSVVTVLAASEPLRSAEGVPTIRVGSATVAVSTLSEVLGLGPGRSTAACAVVVLTGLTRRHAMRVDTLEGRRDVIVKTLSPLLGPLECFTGASVEPDGGVLLVLDAEGTINRGRGAMAHRTGQDLPRPQTPGPGASVLVVDDAMTVRELQRSILERAGYHVRTAGDGSQALAMLLADPADLVLTDVEMPVMDGFALTAAIRSHEQLAGTAVLVLTSRGSDEDRRRGLDAGADGYLIKSGFDEAALLTAVEQLLGPPT